MRLASKSELLFERVVENDDSAKAGVFLQLCREWPELRTWLWKEFANDFEVQKRFAKVVDEGAQPAIGRQWLAEFSGEADSWRQERQSLKEQLGPKVLRPYGGRSHPEIIKLIRQYQAGALDLGTFLLAREWVNSNGKAKDSMRLMRSASEFIDGVVSGKIHLLSHFEKSLQLIKLYKNKAQRRSTLGHVKWWKLQVLLYIFRNPRPFYPMRDLHEYLDSIGITVNLDDVRRFCRVHQIQRDTRAGRPRRKATLRKLI